MDLSLDCSETFDIQENPACTKSDNRDKVLLTSSMADQKEENKRYRETHHQIFNNGDI